MPFAPSMLLTLSCPQTVQFLAHWMRLAPDVAGVTLFAFASGERLGCKWLVPLLVCLPAGCLLCYDHPRP